MQIPRTNTFLAAAEVVERLRAAGHTAYFAGGCVRDWLLERAPKDIDVATSARPEEISALFDDTRRIGASFGVIQVVTHGWTMDVTTFRSDCGYRDGRRPESVVFTTPEEDSRRRDFTINGLFYDPVEDVCIDFVGGQDDLRRRVVRAIGPPAERFAEDYLRMLRAVRCATTLEFEIEPDTLAAIRRYAPRLQDISAERVEQELTRILTESAQAGHALGLLEQTGLLAVILPEVQAMKGQEQPPEFHPEGDVLTHTAMMLDAMQHPTPTLAYAVLLHDVAKPVTAATTLEPDGSRRIRFNNHARIGADMAEEVLRRLRLPNRHVEAVAHCVRNHMRFMDVQKMRTSTLRRMIGALTFAVELELHRLDCLSSHGDLSNHQFLLDYIERIRHEPALPARWITGRDLLDRGMSEGPEVGRWLQLAYDAQLEGDFESREELIEWLEVEMNPPSG